ncbi:MAG: hypothetical protein P1P69_01235 [Methanosarcinaceae archaeon]|nr:hypothetical protein [Methanosarcinaceae archaeon]MDF1533113.1 hypothetical protein [Methanosarcinaceae archaeon]
MNKKLLEIFSAIGSTLIFIILLIGVNVGGMVQKEYGFIVAIVVYIMITSVLGIKLTEIPDN